MQSPGRILKCWFIAACLTVPAGAKAALDVSNEVITPHARVSLLSSTQEIAGGVPFWLALRIQLQPHWHVYWRNPGDSGLAPHIEWQLPPNVTSGSIRWPAPEKFQFNALASYGYEREVLLLTRVAALPGFTDANSVKLAAAVQWLVCKHVCIPEEGTVALELPVAKGKRAAASEHRNLIARWLKRVPLHAEFPVDVQASPDSLRLHAELPQQVSSAWFFPHDFGIVEHAAPQQARINEETLVLTMQRGDLRFQQLNNLRGVLAVTTPQGAREAFSIDVTVK